MLLSIKFTLIGASWLTKRRQAVAAWTLQDDRNSTVFRLRRNDISDCDGAFSTEGGRLFHARTEATGRLDHKA